MWSIQMRKNRWNSLIHPKAHKAYLIPGLWDVQYWALNVRHYVKW